MNPKRENFKSTTSKEQFKLLLWRSIYFGWWWINFTISCITKKPGYKNCWLVYFTTWAELSCCLYGIVALTVVILKLNNNTPEHTLFLENSRKSDAEIQKDLIVNEIVNLKKQSVLEKFSAALAESSSVLAFIASVLYYIFCDVEWDYDNIYLHLFNSAFACLNLVIIQHSIIFLRCYLVSLAFSLSYIAMNIIVWKISGIVVYSVLDWGDESFIAIKVAVGTVIGAPLVFSILTFGISRLRAKIVNKF